MNYLYVGLGGLLGALTRAFFSQLHLLDNTMFPLNTLLINLTGSFILSLFLSLVIHKWHIPANLRLGISTGFLGAYTTFSTFALETMLLFKNGHIFYGIIYSFTSMAGGLFCAWAGITAAEYIWHKREAEGSR